MAEASERSYRWGKFQAWGALAFAVGQFVFVRFPASLFVGIFFLYLWTGLLHKRRYGFVLVYVATGIAVLAGLLHLAIEPTWDVFGQILVAICFWGIPAAFYYPKRYREFDVGKPKPEVASEAVTPTEVERAVVPSRALTDDEVRTVLERIHKRPKQ